MSKKTVEQIEASLTRWKSRLRRAITAIDKLEKQKKRLSKATAVRASAPAYPTVDSEGTTGASGASPTTLGALPPPDLAIIHPLDKPVVKVEDEIPSFLRRQSPDPIAEQIKKEQAETKKAKAKGRIEKMKAKQRGDLKRMPLTGKAALQAIRNG